MADYRLYYHDDVPIMRSEDFEAPSDEQAIRAARARNKRVNCQLWNRDRFVAVIAACPARSRDR